MVPEAPLERTDTGIFPAGAGWFVVNARETRWFENADFGAFAGVEEETHDGEEAYARSAKSAQTAYREGWLP